VANQGSKKYGMVVPAAVVYLSVLGHYLAFHHSPMIDGEWIALPILVLIALFMFAIRAFRLRAQLDLKANPANSPIFQQLRPDSLVEVD
jgi:hypothetical protein